MSFVWVRAGRSPARTHTKLFSLGGNSSQPYAERVCFHRVSLMMSVKGLVSGPTALIGEQDSVAPRRRTGPHLGGLRGSRPVHRESFVCVVGGLRPPTTHTKQFSPGIKNELLPVECDSYRLTTKFGRTSAADGSAPWWYADVLAPCQERVLCGWAAGEARCPPTQNSSLRRESTRSYAERAHLLVTP